VAEQVIVSMTEIAESAKGPAGPGGRRPPGWQLSAESPLWMFASSTRIKPKPAHIGGYGATIGAAGVSNAPGVPGVSSL